MTEKGREQKWSSKFRKSADEAEASESVTEIYTPKMFNRPGSGSEKTNTFPRLVRQQDDFWLTDRLKKEADRPLKRLAGSRLNKPGNLHMRLVLGAHKMHRSLHIPASILSLYRTLMGFSHIDMIQVVPTTHCSIRVCLCNQLQLWEQNIHFKDRGGDGDLLMAWLHLRGQLAVTRSQCPPTATEQENGASDKSEVEIILNLT